MATERTLAQWRGLTTRPLSGQSLGETNHETTLLIQQKIKKEAPKCSGHLVQEQRVHKDWESGGTCLIEKQTEKPNQKQILGKISELTITGWEECREGWRLILCRLPSAAALSPACNTKTFS